jgi:hypothetical protein
MNENTNKITFPDYGEFEPDYTPLQMVKLGVFGGNYFAREHYSENYNDFPEQFKIDMAEAGLCENAIKSKLKSRYDLRKNMFAVYCGSSLDQWIDRNWIFEQDKYGWFEWYIKFYYGRRVKFMDTKQIMRWLSFKARHGGMLRSQTNRIERLNLSMAKKTRQNLLHWAIDSTKI